MDFNVMVKCTVCGKELYDGDKIYLTTTKQIKSCDDGDYTLEVTGEVGKFTEACESCGNHMSATPELLDALKEAKEEVCILCQRLNPQHRDCTSCETVDKWDAIIAKAENI